MFNKVQLIKWPVISTVMALVSLKQSEQNHGIT
jgi:hypothetical protein